MPELVIVAAVGVTGGLARWAILNNNTSDDRLRKLVRALAASAVVSLSLFYALAELDWRPGLRLAVLTVAAFVAEDLLVALRGGVIAATKDPSGMLIDIIKATFGKK